MLYKSIIKFCLISSVFSAPVLVRRNGQLLGLGGSHRGKGSLLDLDADVDLDLSLLGLLGIGHNYRGSKYGSVNNGPHAAPHNNQNGPGIPVHKNDGLNVDVDANVDLGSGHKVKGHKAKGLNIGADVDAKVNL